MLSFVPACSNIKSTGLGLNIVKTYQQQTRYKIFLKYQIKSI